jgi:hypothetical protein
MDIVELVKLRGLDVKDFKVKVFRHPPQVSKAYKVDGKNHILDLNNLYRKDLKYIETYQSYQKKGFECGNYVISFIGTEGVEAKFIGIYKVKGRKRAIDIEQKEVVENLSDFLQQSGLLSEQNFGIDDSTLFFELERVDGFDDLKDRVVIDWRKATLSWHQWLSKKNGSITNNKEVLEILRKGYVMDFPGYEKVNIKFYQLIDIIENPDANREWKNSLAAVAGVYLIVDDKTGMQYVGSASGEEGGILDRWKNYVRRGGRVGNKKLEELISKDKDYAKKYFRFSILHILSKTIARKEVIKWEEIYKKKLGTRAMGLNL